MRNFNATCATWIALTFALAMLLIGCGGNAGPASNPTPTVPTTGSGGSGSGSGGTGSGGGSSPSPAPAPAPTPAPPPTSGGSGAGTTGTPSAAYTIQDIGNPGGAESLNDNDQVTGTGPHAWIWQNGKVTDLGTLTGSGTSWGLKINNSGQVAGFSTASDGQNHPFLYSNGKMQDLGLPPTGVNAEGWGLNNVGQVVGFGNTTSGAFAFEYTDGKMQVLSSGAEARAINDGGVVVGNSNGKAVMWVNGVMTDLGVPPDEATAYRINNANQIVGTFDQSRGSGQMPLVHAFLWTNGTYKDLGTLPGFDSADAWGINEAGVVVGRSFDNAEQVVHLTAYIYQNGQMKDLNTLLPPNSGWVLQLAYDINNKGQILAGGTHNGKIGYCILTPNP